MPTTGARSYVLPLDWPDELVNGINQFLKSENTGSIELHIERGEIRAWRFIERGRVEKRVNTARERP